jgi:PAS domain S-box-containing protein
VVPSEIIGKHIRNVIGEELFLRNLPYIEGVLRGNPQEFERDIPSQDGGSVRYSLAQYFPHFADGNVVGFVSLVTDITTVKRAQLDVLEANALLEMRINERTRELNAASFF